MCATYTVQYYEIITITSSLQHTAVAHHMQHSQQDWSQSTPGDNTMEDKVQGTVEQS